MNMINFQLGLPTFRIMLMMRLLLIGHLSEIMSAAPKNFLPKTQWNAAESPAFVCTNNFPPFTLSQKGEYKRYMPRRAHRQIASFIPLGFLKKSPSTPSKNSHCKKRCVLFLLSGITMATTLMVYRLGLTPFLAFWISKIFIGAEKKSNASRTLNPHLTNKSTPYSVLISETYASNSDASSA